MKNTILILTLLMSPLLSIGQNDISLNAAIDSAKSNNKSIIKSDLEVLAAKELKKEAFTKYFPNVSANAGAYYSINPLLDLQIGEVNLPVYDGNPVNIATATEFAYFPGMDLQMFQKSAVGMVNVVQPIYTGGRILNGNKLATLNIEAKEEQKLLSERDIEIKVEQQYWQLLSLHKKLELVNEYQMLLDTIFAQVNDAYKAGLIIKNDVLKVRLKQNELMLNKEKLENGILLATNQFCLTIGIKNNPDLLLNEQIEILESPDNYYANKDSALVNRIEYSLLEKSINASDLQIKMAQGENLPQLAIGFNGYLYNSLEENANSSTNGMVFGTLSVPISSWWGGTHQVKRLKIEKRISEQNFEEKTSLLGLQIEKLWLDINSSYSQLKIQENIIKQAEENVRVSKSAYLNGLITITDLIQAQTILSDAKSTLLDSKIQYRLTIRTYQLISTNFN